MRAFAGLVMHGRWAASLIIAGCVLLSLVAPTALYRLLQGGAVGAMAASLVAGCLGVLSGAAVALVTLRQGAREGLLVMLLAAGFAALPLALAKDGNALTTGVLLVLVWLPLWLMATVLRRSVSLPRALVTGAALAAAVVLLVHALAGDVVGWWQALLEPAFIQAGKQGMMHADAAALKAAVAGLARVMTGVVAAAMLVSLIVNLLLARWWQALLYNPGGFRQEFRDLRLGREVAWLVVALLVLAFVGPAGVRSIALELLLIAMAALFFGGLAVVHWVNGRAGGHKGWLVALYVMLLWFSFPVFTILAATGLADTWLDLRQRLVRGRS